MRNQRGIFSTYSMGSLGTVTVAAATTITTAVYHLYLSVQLSSCYSSIAWSHHETTRLSRGGGGQKLIFMKKFNLKKISPPLHETVLWSRGDHETTSMSRGGGGEKSVFLEKIKFVKNFPPPSRDMLVVSWYHETTSMSFGGGGQFFHSHHELIWIHHVVLVVKMVGTGTTCPKNENFLCILKIFPL